MYLKHVDEVYVTDAYHSLSIEGYRVSRELIERARSGDWNPDANEHDRLHRDALAARGYHQAFGVVKKSVHAVLTGQNAGSVADNARRIFSVRTMFSYDASALRRSCEP